MTLALHAPDIISDVVAVDNSPVALPLPKDFEKYMEALVEVEHARVQTHAEGEQILAKFEEVHWASLPFICWLLGPQLTNY